MLEALKEVCQTLYSVLFKRKELEKELEDAYRERIAALRTIPTSSTNQLKGYRINRQIKLISVSNHTNQDAAELDFLQRVVDAGGSGAINFSIRHHRGGFISVQGDAVIIR